MDVDPSARISLDRRVRTGSISLQLRAIGQSLEMAFLSRDIDVFTISTAVRNRDLPLALVVSVDAESGEILVLAEDAPGRAALRVLQPSDEAEKLPARSPAEIEQTRVLQFMQLQVVERILQRVFAHLALEFSFHLPRVRYDVFPVEIRAYYREFSACAETPV